MRAYSMDLRELALLDSDAVGRRSQCRHRVLRECQLTGCTEHGDRAAADFGRAWAEQHDPRSEIVVTRSYERRWRKTSPAHVVALVRGNKCSSRPWPS